MEVETMCRYKMPVKIIILNNGGIGGGMDELPTDKPIPAPILTPRARYDLMMEAFGGKGFLVEDPKDLRATLDEAMAFDGPVIVNVLIHPKAGRKPQQFDWLTKEE
jgi:thiamine pyrophosphate-dependent acetolactate synthase large subunit-like protein